MPSERGVLLRRAAITAVLAGGMGAGVTTVALAATHGSAPSTGTSTTATKPSAAPSTAPSAKPSAKPAHNCPNMGHGSAHSGSGTSSFRAAPGQGS
jgi:hypothetical protein